MFFSICLFLYRWLAPILALPTTIYLLAYTIPQLYITYLAPVPDLKRRYDASWALVTGGGSGIGKSLCFALARQELNVVVVSLDDQCLKDTVKELKEVREREREKSERTTSANARTTSANEQAAASPPLFTACVYVYANLLTPYSDRPFPSSSSAPCP